MSLVVVQLYQKEMNIYGDSGNLEVIEHRLKARGIDYISKIVNVGDKLPEKVDILICGGGQDSGQIAVAKDLIEKKMELLKLVENGTVMLLICGAYQLFGEEFVTSEDKKIKGLGILPIKTVASSKRIIGNIVIENELGKIVGYENHSGRTYFTSSAKPLGKVLVGGGNNGEDESEGIRLNNIFASYLHGPILSKNPALADEMIRLALLKNKIPIKMLKKLDDTMIEEAKNLAMKRPR